MSDGSGSPVSSRAIIWALALVGTALARPLSGGSIADISQLLTIACLLGAGALLCRHLFHVYEGYYVKGLLGPMLAELGTALGMVAMAALLARAADPQIPALAICGVVSALALLFGTTWMEERRAAASLLPGLRVRRATDVLRQSGVWRFVCKRFKQVDFEFARRLRRKLAGPDSKDGDLSLGASIVFLTQVAIGLLATSLLAASTVVPVQLTPDQKRGGGEPPRERPDGKGEKPGGADTTRVPVDPSVSAKAVECGTGYDPGPGVPEPQRSSLLLAWHEIPGLVPGPMEALGFDVAGCPRPARPLPGSPGSWFALGYCGEDLQALALAQRGLDHPVVLLEQAAEFALPLVLDGELEGALDRFPVGGGDAYVIDSRRGSYVLFRDRTTAGSVEGAEGRPGGCGGFVDQDVEYAIVGPGLIELWRAVAAISLGGVYPIDYARQEDGTESVVFRSPEGIVGAGLCSTPHFVCHIDIGGARVHGRPGTYITREEVIALVDPA